MHYLLFYEVGEDYVARRPRVSKTRTSKRPGLRVRAANSYWVAPWRDPADGAVLLFKGDTPAVAENFAQGGSVCDQRLSKAMARAGVDDGSGRKTPRILFHPERSQVRKPD